MTTAYISSLWFNPIEGSIAGVGKVVCCHGLGLNKVIPVGLVFIRFIFVLCSFKAVVNLGSN